MSKDDPQSPPTGQRRSRPRLHDVAAAAGVSIVTVSRAMNVPDTVSAKTRRKIEAAMLAVDYVPDLVARSMAQQRTGVVAAFVPNLMDPIFVSTIQGLGDVLAGGGLHLLLGNTQYRMADEDGLVSAALGRRPDALVLSGTTHTDRLRRLVLQSGIPIVETWNYTDEPIDWVVGFSHADAGFAQTRHLLDRGFRRIGYFGRPTDGNERAAGKQRGYRLAMAEAGLAVLPEWVVEVDTSMQAGAVAIDRLVTQLKLEAIVFSGDHAAAGAYLTCLARGIRVPQDVALCGFGDHEIAAMIPGGLTTIRVDAYGIGRTAGEMILSALRGDTAAERLVDVGFDLVVRSST
jgi:LacI family transcriptional regulator, gluconate utilization system Gnt-I transcriptional repressor